MPVFHTKTIESILEPVALQVSRLVILHEEAEDGNAMPDLERPVQVVSRAVANLVKVGRETIASSDDPLLRQDMPSALAKVERASHLLEDAARLLKEDPYSAPARKRLIEGSGGILQATSALLLCFDESEVRKLVRECHRVLDYLAVAEVIETMEELVQFLRDLSPCLSKVSREVSAREKELTHQVHAEILIRCLEQVKTLAPILICSMKVFIHVVSSGGKGVDEAAENRNYLARRMSDEIHEIIRVLQLTTYDEDQSDLDNLTVLKKLSNAIQNKMNAANDWLMDPTALRGGIGEKSLRQILEHAERVAERCLPEDAASISKQISSLHTMTDALCELRATLKSPTPQSESLSKGIREALSNLQASILSSIVSVDRLGLQQAAHTVSGRLEQARKWLSNPDKDDRGLGRRAIELIVEEGRKVAKGLPGAQQQELGELCERVNVLCEELSANASTPRAPEIARKLAHALHELKQKISHALVTRVVQDFMDVASPLKGFVDAVNVPEGTPGRDQNFGERAQALQAWSARAVKTAQMVAAGGSGGNKKLAESLLNASSQVESLTPQLISAGSLRMHYPQSKAADEHFDNLRQQWQDTVMRVRGLCDEATNSSDFIRASEEQMQKHSFLCEEAIRNKSAHKMVDNTSAIARLANRVLLVAKQESDNSEDPAFISSVNQAADRLQEAVPVMVAEAKAVAVNPNDSSAASRWREANKMLLGAVAGVRDAVMPQPELPPLPDVSALNMNDSIKPQTYFADKVGESVRQIPSPEPRRELSPPPSHHGRISPLPKWARGDNSELLCRELADQCQSNREETAPPRPPLPTQDTSLPSRPPAPAETDDEDDVFHRAGAAGAQHPIMQAARGLHAEVRQWSSKDNAMVAAAKRMARLMARLSELVREDCRSSKRELIATAKQLAEAGEEVTRLAKLLARECTDKRIRTNLLQVCERIPTIGTQLKILSTVKATMLGAQGSEEDREATEMLEGNAQNLMQSVKETVRAAEAASIKIHTQSQGRMQWVRRLPWYHY